MTAWHQYPRYTKVVGFRAAGVSAASAGSFWALRLREVRLFWGWRVQDVDLGFRTRQGEAAG